MRPVECWVSSTRHQRTRYFHFMLLVKRYLNTWKVWGSSAVDAATRGFLARWRMCLYWIGMASHIRTHRHSMSSTYICLVVWRIFHSFVFLLRISIYALLGLKRSIYTKSQQRHEWRHIEHNLEPPRSPNSIQSPLKRSQVPQDPSFCWRSLPQSS